MVDYHQQWLNSCEASLCSQIDDNNETVPPLFRIRVRENGYSLKC